MEILISFAAKVAEYTVAPIGRQAGYLLCYKGNFKELEDHVKELEFARERLNHRVAEERGSSREIENDVVNWLKEVNEVIEKANWLQEDPRRANVGCSGWSSFPNLILRHRLSRNATKIAKDVVELKGKGKFDRVGYLRPLLDGVAFSTSSATRGGEKLEERESFKEGVVKALKDPNSRIIGVYGLPGVGKTTLVKEVAQIAKQDNMFDKVVKADVSETPDIKTIQGEIADRLGLQFKEETVAGRADSLRQRIKAEKTILVILDDIWTSLDLEKVGIPYGYDHNGCKLLMTSRNQEVLQHMEAQKDFTFRLELLSEAETWSLFQSKAADVVKDNNLKAIATQVAQKCAGLPLRIVMVACALRDKKDVKHWKDALRQLETNDHAGMDAKTYAAFELSYKYLENEEMKPLFLLFAVLQDSNVEYILKVAMGLDIFLHTNTVDGARNKLYSKIESLKASCLLLDGSTSGKLQMHDLVRGFAISIACKDHHVFIREEVDDLNEWPIEDFLKSCPQIILKECHIPRLSQRLYCPNIKLFYLFSANRYLEISDTFFEGMGNLKVLDLSYLHLPSLPTSFRSLISLQTLCLDHCLLENMDAIEALKNLEILSLSCSSMIKLPCQIGRLTKLRMLDLSDSGIEVIPPNIISCLTELEELYMGNTSIKWEDENSTMQNDNANLIELQNLSHLTALELQICEAWILPRGLNLMFETLNRYKIAIGDVWEWADIEDGTLNTLMLKLSTNICLEHGIKALIKGVENLYLDQVDGIHNVFYQLNLEGFPSLKHLHIQNNANMKHIIDSLKNQDHGSFINLETLVLQNLRNLEQICRGPLAANSFGNLGVIKVKTCVQLKYLLSFSMLKGLSQLSEIEVFQCNSMEEIVLGDSGSNDIHNEKIEFVSLRSMTLEHLHNLDDFFSYELTSSITERLYQRVETRFSAPLFTAQVSFPKLDTLRLSSLKMNKIWYDNQHSMNYLTNLIVENCGGLKYLFSSTMVESFNSLKRLEISKCHLMEEIIATDNRNNGTVASNEAPFTKLETIILKDMENLKAIWHYHFGTLKTLQVVNCEKIVVVFPSSMQKTYCNLEVLEVADCALVEEIFESTYGENSSIEDPTHLKRITLHGLPKLKKIWSMDPQGILSFRNLETVDLNQCGSLEYLFPLSVATCCSHLKELYIKSCINMKEIVAEKNESMCTAPIFEFNELNTLLLWSLDKLKCFYAGNHTLACPSLRTINVSMCAKLNLYKTISTSSPESSGDGKLPNLMQEPVFIVEEVIPNLKKLKINHRDANVILQAQNLGALFTKLTCLGLCGYTNEEAAFPYWFLQNVRTLESLVVEWSSFKKIFQDERVVSGKIHTRLKKLSLNQLPRLQHICEEGSPIDPVLEVLEYLEVFHCLGLTNLLPSSVTFNHLIDLEITNCNGLINLITSRVARSLVKLITMKVKDCNSLEEIIVGEENVDIAFISLEVLMLECLPILNKFCSSKCFLKFPLLEEVVVRECPRMKIFSEGKTSTPTLRKVIAETGEEWHWKESLNDTIKNMFENKVAFCSLKSLKLSEYPELKELWYGQLQHNVFRSLKCLVVHKCYFLSDVLFQPNLLEVLVNLEELDIRDCNSLEAVFALKDKFGEENLVKNSTQLKKLTLCDLPTLKHVWKEDPHNTLRFQNLCEVSVMGCKDLTSLFPLSVARDVMELQNLQVRSCGIEEIVAKEGGKEEMIEFVFPQLTSLNLEHLPKLKAFFAGAHSLQCKSLKTIDVLDCQKLKLFMTKPPRPQERVGNDKLNVSTYQPLFLIEEVLANVENLSLNSKDFSTIWKSQYVMAQFNKVKLIRVCEFTNEKAVFPYWFLKNVPNLENLAVEWSYFTEIFHRQRPIGEERGTQISIRLRKLCLCFVDRLQHICKVGFQMDPILQHLESLEVHHCTSLINLVPSTVTFTYLTYLEVTNCNGLANLITGSTAKSLVKLTTMKIKMCNLLEDVVNGKEDETNNGIAFCSLQYLELISLPRLHRFCSCVCPIKFPLLEVVVVEECSRMELFSMGETRTPNLQYVKIDENYQEYYWDWDGDLNETIKNMFGD